MKSIKSFDGTKISYIIHSGKEFIVFVHGMGCNHTFWKKEFNWFRKKGYGIIALDLRGHGSSDKPKKKYKAEYFAKDLKAILKKEGVKKAIVVGHSLGGIVSLAFYKLAPSFVKRLILVNTTYKVTEHSVRKTYEFVVKHRLYKAFFKLENVFRTPKKSNVDLTKAKNLADIIYDTSFISPGYVGEACVKGLLGFDMTDYLGKIKVPVLVIGSKKDEIFTSKIQKDMCKRIKDCELIFLNYGHALPLKRSDLVSREIFEFLNQR